jgi:formiminoglutamase
MMNDISPLKDFFQAIDIDFLSGGEDFKKSSLGDILEKHTIKNGFPNQTTAKLAIIGVCEERGANGNAGCSKGVDFIRKYLYDLFIGEFSGEIVDLGNINAGHEINDTYFALAQVCSLLMKKDILPIIIGGSQDLTYGQFKGYETLEATVNGLNIDARFDLGHSTEILNSHSFVGKIILHQPNFLFNYSHLAYQTYFVSQEELGMMNKLYFDTYRLGQIRNKIEDTEPIIRHSDFISIDISAIKAADAPGHENVSPNGLSSDEICQMMRYAGMSDKCSSIGFYEYNPIFDINGHTAHLTAQMIWCFFEGYFNRKKDFPKRNHPDYHKYTVSLENNKYEIVFYKSIKSDRWWMDVPYPPNDQLKYERHHLVPCTYNDYQLACKDEMPDRWWLTYQKLM